jgi:tRNA (cytidine32/uridine32-2'-O)-methyltransferase
MLARIRIVLVATSHPGNIGASARAMKTMGLSQLVLVQPGRFPCVEATARASGADDVLAQARVCASLDEALHGCRLVIATTARSRALAWPVFSPKECASQILAHLPSPDTEVAILFGREHSGLRNEELEHCHAVVEIPANPVYSSLNLAAAVQIIAYELRCAAHDNAPAPVAMPAAHEDMERFYAHLEETLITLKFLDPAKPKRLMTRLRRLFNRARPDDSEVNILRGILSALQASKSKSD